MFGTWSKSRIVGTAAAACLAGPTFAHDSLTPASPSFAASQSDQQACTPVLAASPLDSPYVWGPLVGALLAGIAIWVMGVVKPGGLDKNRRDVSIFPAWLWLSGAVIIYAGVIIGGALAATFARAAFASTTDSARQIAIGTLGSQGLALVAGFTLVRLASTKQRNTGLRVRTGDLRRGLVAFAIVMPLVLATSVIGSIVYTKVRGSPPDNVAHALLKMYRDTPKDPWVWVLLASAVFIGPVVEELIYRAFLQTGFLALFRRAWVAVISTSLLFTLAHLGGEGSPTVPWHALPTLFVLSLGMGIAYERSGRLGVPILMHVLFNAFNVGMMVLATKGA